VRQRADAFINRWPAVVPSFHLDFETFDGEGFKDEVSHIIFTVENEFNTYVYQQSTEGVCLPADANCVVGSA
jgi:hypothetical protein